MQADFLTNRKAILPRIDMSASVGDKVVSAAKYFVSFRIFSK